MAEIIFFTGIPIDDAATFHRAGLVAKKLIKQGHSLVFASVAGDFVRPKVKKVDGLKVYFIGQAHYWASKPFSKRFRLGLGRVLWENIKTCFRFIKLLKQEKPALVLTVTSMPVSLMVGLIAKFLGIKTRIDIEDFVVGQMEAADYPRLLVKVFGYIEKIWLKIFDKVIVCSSFLKIKYPGSYLIPNMIDVGFWQQRKRPSKNINMVFVGQMGAYHGQAEVLTALTPVLQKNKNLKLVFIGGGERMTNLKFKIKNAKLERQVSLTGQISQVRVRDNLCSADIGLLPLWNIAVHQARHPLKLLEYLAAGLVVITNKVGEAAYIIKDKKNGLICPPGDIDCLAKKVEYICNKPDLIRKISDKAVFSVSKFSVENIMPKWQEILGL